MPQPHRPTPTYEGRALPRPDEELVDQGLGFDVGTLLSRRRLLAALGLGAASVGLSACGAGGPTSSSAAAPTASSAEEIPEETAGPYPGDGSNGPDVLEQSGIVRSDIRSSFGEYSGTAEGVPMTLELIVRDLTNGGVPFEGVAVYVWHCTREGGYSLSSASRTRTTCAACRSPTPVVSSATPACSRPATTGAGRTSTSRSTRTRPASPMPRTPSPPPRSRCPRTSARGLRDPRLRGVGGQPVAGQPHAGTPSTGAPPAPPSD